MYGGKIVVTVNTHADGTIENVEVLRDGVPMDEAVIPGVIDQVHHYVVGPDADLDGEDD